MLLLLPEVAPLVVVAAAAVVIFVAHALSALWPATLPLCHFHLHNLWHCHCDCHWNLPPLPSVAPHTYCQPEGEWKHPRSRSRWRKPSPQNSYHCCSCCLISEASSTSSTSSSIRTKSTAQRQQKQNSKNKQTESLCYALFRSLVLVKLVGDIVVVVAIVVVVVVAVAVVVVCLFVAWGKSIKFA